MERFWSKIDIRGPDDCWEFIGNRHRQGYGFFKIGETNKLAHRLAVEFTTGITLTREIHVRHLCDNPPCCNPKHLVPGTRQENMEDMAAKGRARRGRFSDDQVRAIREDTRMMIEIESELGLSRGIVSRIKSRKIYRRVE